MEESSELEEDSEEEQVSEFTHITSEQLGPKLTVVDMPPEFDSENTTFLLLDGKSF